MSQVFVSHPGLQHSHQLAWGLNELGILQSFWSAVPVIGNDQIPPFWLPNVYAQRIKNVGIPRELRRHPTVFRAMQHAGSLLPASFSREDYNHRIFHFFDWWVAKQIKTLRPKAVVAYENSAYHTFQAAKAIGARCILDAPSLHHKTCARLMTVKATNYLAEINRRKNEEINLADLILTCSPLAAQSYLDAGVESEKISSMLLGATFPEGILAWQHHSQPLHFIFAGGLRYLKAIDTILAAFKRLHDEALPYRLSFVGGEGEPGWIEKIEQTPAASYYPGMAQSELYQMLAKADCLLLPSRFDSFGMVVAEALACGTPVIVSTQTGSKAILEQFPNAGWVVDCDQTSLYQCVKERIQDRNTVFSARAHALEASRHFTWKSYRRRVGSLIEGFLSL